MTIKLTQSITISGSHRAIGTTLALSPGEESELVNRGVAIWVGGDPSIIPEAVERLSQAGLSGRGMPLAVQSIHTLGASPLDLSARRLTATPAGSRGRIQIHGSNTEKLAEASAPTLAVNFMIATWAPSSAHGNLPLEKASITAGVEHLARRGFNALRVHGLEYWLCSGAGNNGDFYFPPERLDAFDWLLAEAKRVGLYWIFNPRQPELYQAGPSRFAMPGSAKNFKHRIFVQQDARDHYELGFNLLYNRRNAYTGVNMLQDPALMLVQWFNECTFQQMAQGSWPAVWTTRESARGTAALTFNEWLADSAQAHGYANLAALNTDWGTAHASFAAIPAPTALPNTSISGGQGWAVTLYGFYMDEALASYFAAFANQINYTGLGASLLIAPGIAALRTWTKTAGNAVANAHDYTFTVQAPAPGTALDVSRPNAPVWSYGNYLSSVGSYAADKPAFVGEYGWPYPGDYRNQFPMVAGYAALQGAAAISHFHQGNFFVDQYNGRATERIAKLFPYEGHSDPVAKFTDAAMFFAFHRANLNEGAVKYTVTFNDRYYGVTPKVTGRLNRAFARLFIAPSLIPMFTRTRVTWESDTTSDALAATLNTQDFYTHLDALLVAGAITADNLGLASANVNRGTITAVEISGTVGSVTATPTAPVLTLSAGNTLVDGDQIAITNLTGSGGTWPGTNNRGTRATILQTGVANKVQIVSGAPNLTGTSGFTAGSWCELDNVVQSGNEQIFLSRRHKVAVLNATRFKYFADGGANPAIYPYALGLNNLEVVSCSTGAALFLAALDDADLTTSEDILLGLVSKSRNAGESYTTAANTTWATVGDWPIVLEEASAVLKLTRNVWGRFVLDALAINGDVVASTELGTLGAALIITLDTAPRGTVFWRLRRLAA